MLLQPFLKCSFLFCLVPLPSLLALPTRPAEQELPRFDPIPFEQSTASESEYRAVELKWKEAAFLTPLLQADTESSWLVTATPLIAEAFRLQAEAGVLPFSLAPLGSRFGELMALQPHPPLIGILAAQSLFDDSRDWREPSRIVESIIATHPVPLWLRAQALQLHIALLKHQGADYRFPRGDLVDTLIEILNSADLVATTPVEVMVRQQMSLLTAAEVTLDDYIVRWLEAVKSSGLPDWAKLTLLGFGETELAWIKRTSKWASDVSAEQWQGFNLHLGNAQDHLEKAWEANPSRPEAAALMITVTMGTSQRDDALRLWFDRSVVAQFDYYPAYNKMLWALTPRWCGSHQHMLAFGLACARTKRFDTGVPAYLFHAAQDITIETREHPGVFSDIDSKPAILEAAAGYIDEAHATNPQLPQQVRQSISSISAWLARDPALAARGFAGIGGRFSQHGKDFLSVLLLHESQFRAEIAAGSGQFGPEIQKFASLSKQQQPMEWASALTAIPLADLSQEALHYVEEWRESQNLTNQLETGAWVPWTPHPHLTTLTSTGGRWKVEDGALVAIGDDSPSAVLLLTSLDGIPLEIRAEVEVSEPEPPQPSPQGWSFGFTHHWRPASSSSRAGGLSFAVQSRYPGNFEAIVYNRRPSQAIAQHSLPSQLPFSLQSWSVNGAYSFAVNSQWQVDRQLDESQQENEKFGAPGFITERLPFGVRLIFRNIELKKAGPQPTPSTAPTLPQPE